MGKPSVLLIDLSALFHPAWHANENGPISVAFDATLGGVRRCVANAVPGSLVAVCCDGKGNWRKTLAPSYKAHREKLDASFYGEFARVKERLSADGFLLWEVDGFEADDLIATAALAGAKAGHEIRIASNDKDMLQLVSSNCDYLSTRTFDILDGHAVREKFGVGPGYMLDFLALVGDSSDNVKGAPGIGPQRAAKLLNDFQSIDVIYDKLDRDAQALGTPAIVKGLRDGRADVMLARQLVALRFDAPIDFAEIYAERTAAPLPIGDGMEQAIDEDSSETDAPATAPDAGPPVTADLQPAEQSQAPITEIETAPRVAEDSTALVRLDFTQQLEPRSFKELVLGCKILWQARIYGKYKSAEAMVAAALRGREMGYGLGASLDIFHVMEIEGRTSLALHAHVIIDRAMRDPDCEYVECIETNDAQATYEVKRKSRPEPFRLTYTLEQAKAAGLFKVGGKWDKRPSEYLRKTAGVQACRVVFPGPSMGLYCIEEMGD